MHLLLVSTELSPFVVKTEAAEAIASLSRALRLLGHEVTLALPRLPEFEQAGLMMARRLTPLGLARRGDSKSAAEAHVYEASLPSGARLVLLDVPGWNPSALDGKAPDRNGAEALGWFTDAVAALVVERGEAETPLDVIHLHDASSGYALHKLRQRGVLTPIVLTVHDAARAIEFPLDVADRLGLDAEAPGAEDFRSGAGISVLQGILPLADAVLAPSDSYAAELQSAARFGALATAFRGNPAVGILGGIDPAVFNPSTDTALPHRYDALDTSNKGRVKARLAEEIGLGFDLGKPVFLYEDIESAEGGLELVFSSLIGIVRAGVRVVIASRRSLDRSEQELVALFPDEVRVVPTPDAKTKRRLLAGSDFWLGLERQNPSGLAIQKAARYGAIPVALARDAGKDTIVDADAELLTGTGIAFDEFETDALLGAVARAVTAFKSENFPRFLARVMRQDLAWDRPARRHVQIYRQAAGVTR